MGAFGVLWGVQEGDATWDTFMGCLQANTGEGKRGARKRHELRGNQSTVLRGVSGWVGRQKAGAVAPKLVRQVAAGRVRAPGERAAWGHLFVLREGKGVV